MGLPKLYQWLLGAGSFMSVWLAYVAGYFKADLSDGMNEVILVLPLYLLMVFACFSLAVVGYRVTTFNDCVEASEELKQQVAEAKADLEAKGFKYASDWK
ncbi:dolichol-phosphate mannosyltransferase subunit 3 [Aplysia californica]|uniref:Dolichol-phosphate mannosyltransferase subunit 3 n=1 Tax=Aplysia californica TaxID=6500 RepID=A0ABM0JKN7_APLCA|nr:dolichol-phosphate mannosyltransferase subunit 3 [Aplysia californica]